MKIKTLLLLSLLIAFNIHNIQAQVPSKEIVNQFYDAVRENNFDVAKRLITDKKFPANFEPTDKVTPLQMVIWQNNLELVKTLVENGANINSKVKSAVEEAAGKGFLEILTFLVENGGDKNYFSTAASNDHYECAKYLLLKGANQNSEEGDAKLRFLLDAIKKADFTSLNALTIDKNLINQNNCDGETPLIATIRKKDAKLVKFILSKGASKTKPETFDCGDDVSYGLKPIQIATKLKNAEVIKLLK